MPFVLKGGLYIEKAATDMMVAADTEEMMSEGGWVRKDFWRRRNSSQLSEIIRQQDVDDQLRVYDVEASFASQDGLEEIDFELGPDLTLKVLPFGVETVIDYVEQAAADPVIDYASRKTQDAKFKFFQSLEKVAADKIRDPATLTFGRALTNAERLDNYASPQSNPILQLVMLIQSIKNDVGHKPNVIGIDDLTWQYGFKLHPFAIARSPVHVAPSIMGAGATLTPTLLENILELAPGTIKIYDRRYNPRRKGETTGAVRKSFMGSDIVGAYVQDPNLYSTGFGFETCFTGLAELPADYPFAVLTYDDPKRGLYGSQRVRIVSLINWTVLRAASAYRITNTVDLTDQNKYFYRSYAVLD